jgi:hypothetical protein
VRAPRRWREARVAARRRASARARPRLARPRQLHREGAVAAAAEEGREAATSAARCSSASSPTDTWRRWGRRPARSSAPSSRPTSPGSPSGDSARPRLSLPLSAPSRFSTPSPRRFGLVLGREGFPNRWGGIPRVQGGGNRGIRVGSCADSA